MRPADTVVAQARHAAAVHAAEKRLGRKLTENDRVDPVVLVEDVTRRGVFTKTFKLPRGKRHVSLSREPVHYRDDFGRMAEIDLAWRPSDPATGHSHEVVHAPYRAFVLAGKIGVRHESRAGGWLEMILTHVDGQAVSPLIPVTRVDGQTVFWDQVVPGLDLKLCTYPHKTEIFKQMAGPHELTWAVEESEGFKGKFDDAIIGNDGSGNRLEIVTSRDGGVFTEKWTGRVSKIKDPRTRQKGWVEVDAGDIPVIVDASIVETIVNTADDGHDRQHVKHWTLTYGGEPEDVTTTAWDQVGYVTAGVNNISTSTTTTVTTTYGSTHRNAWGWEGYRWTAGLRFRSLNIPAGATIDAATLRVRKYRVATPAHIRIKGNDVDDAPVWSAGNPPHAAGKTSTSVAWSPTTTAVYTQTDTGHLTTSSTYPISRWVSTSTLNVLGPVAEVLGRGGWASGNDLALILSHTNELPLSSYVGNFWGVGDGNWAVGVRIDGYEYGGSTQLDITYTPGGSAPPFANRAHRIWRVQR